MERSTNTSRLKKAQSKNAGLKMRGTTVEAYKQKVINKVLGVPDHEPAMVAAPKPGGFMTTDKRKKKTNKVWRSRATKRRHRRNLKNR